jgi:endonuclease/exonuclease/phosphatase family metal-dependent hydrolase
MARTTTMYLCLGTLLMLTLTACGGRQPAPATPEPEPPPEPMTLDVLSYNVWLLPPAAVDRETRAELIPAHLLGYDVVVLNEAWEDEPRERIVAAMATRGYTATPVLGGDVELECGAAIGPIRVGVSLGMNGGVIALSKLPLLYTAERLFESACVGEDCCAAKGVLYARYRREDGLCLHVFGTHLQNQSPEVGSSEDAAGARAAQLGIIRAFIDEQVDPSSCPGPVIVAGDLNLLRSELPEAARILRARIPQHFEGPHSYGEHSRRTDPDVPEHLDYVLATEDYAAPLYSVNETRIFRAMHAVSRGILGLRHRDQVSDLSDHHPLAAHFEWRAPVAEAHLAWHIDAPSPADADRCTARYGAAAPRQDEGGFFCAEPDAQLHWSTTSDASCANVRDCERGAPPAERTAFCAADLTSVFCPHGLTGAPCENLEGPRRCIQVVDPASDEANAFDDYLCYRAASRGAFHTTAPACVSATTT